MDHSAKSAVKDSVDWAQTVHQYGGKAHDMGDKEETRQIPEKVAY